MLTASCCSISNVNPYYKTTACSMFLNVQFFVVCSQEQLTYFIHDNMHTGVICYHLEYRLHLQMDGE